MKGIVFILLLLLILTGCWETPPKEQSKPENKNVVAIEKKSEPAKFQGPTKIEEGVLQEFKERVIGSELLDELIPSYDERRNIVNSKMTIEQIFNKYCGDAKIQWKILSPEELEKSDLGVAMGNTFKLMLSLSDKETLEKTRREINEKKYDSGIYGIKVEVTKTYPVDRQKPEIRIYEEGFLFDRRDKKVKHLMLGLMNGISAIDFSTEAKGKKDWK